ncbi:P-loop containing nucleoside triphosphate hydrolase protein [Stemphylium lycopersici]|nr:hypothetical protein TW65_03233 [Stemphylium lycopersici]RAR00197.1 P-loop containing nucleoside triphosphate hydrolase protein [Stemphylium lycopersici]
MREAPIIKISLPKLSRGSPYPMAAVSKLVQDEFELLSSNAQGEVMALTHYTDPARSAQPDILGTIFRTNAYNTGDKVALFPRIARINHSCRPNSGYYWSEKLNRRIVFVTRKVKAGEEFFVSYISLLLSQEDRQKQLDRYGFKCQCEACTQERAAREASDHRRATIKRAFANFEYQLDLAPPASDAERGYARKGAEASAQLAQLVQAEGLADYYAKAYRIAAISHARLEDWEAAAVWANKGFEIRYMEDPESPSTMEMQQLTTTFISNWQNHLQQRIFKAPDFPAVDQILPRNTSTMANPRLIDSDERTRKKPMRVLVLGMCRTGTTSIAVALRKLGYTPHQMRDVLNKPSDLALWQEAINLTLLPPRDRSSSQQNQTPYGRPEFDKILGSYDAVMDLPGCVFAKELMEAYPDAKVILTKRKYEDWEHSMQESLWCLDTWRLFTLCRRLNVTQLAPLMRLVHSVFKVHSDNNYGGPAAKLAFDKHYATVRSTVPETRLLELDTDAELSWEPLCEFLGDQVPREVFPRLNEEKAMRKGLESAWWGMLQYFIMMILLPSSVAVCAYFLFMSSDGLRAYRDECLTRVRKYMDTGEW